MGITARNEVAEVMAGDGTRDVAKEKGDRLTRVVL